jgi:hypothetical protein
MIVPIPAAVGAVAHRNSHQVERIQTAREGKRFFFVTAIPPSGN